MIPVIVPAKSYVSVFPWHLDPMHEHILLVPFCGVLRVEGWTAPSLHDDAAADDDDACV